MKRKRASGIIVFVIGVLSCFLTIESQNPKTLNKSLELPRRVETRIILTKHAQCRMKCRNIDMQEIKQALSRGRVNARKSKRSKKPCPVIARETYSPKDKQEIRVISADCSESTTIITVIDLTESHQCSCR